MKPIETRAYGHRFRSRLEAKWAVAFTHAQIEWHYEPEGFDLGDAGFYLPDFWLPQVSMWAEVKAGKPSPEEIKKAEELARQTDWPCLLLIGPPSVNGYWAIRPDLEVMDYCLFEGRQYHLSEKRFFENSGVSGKVFPYPVDIGYDQHPAVVAALSARFEHGEQP